MVSQVCLNNMIIVAKCCSATIAGDYVKAKTFGDKIADSLLRKLKQLKALIGAAEGHRGIVETEWEFDCPDCWIFDELLIEVTGGVAKLIGPAFDQTNPTIKIDCALEGCEILDLEETVTKVGNDDIRYTVEVNGAQMALRAPRNRRGPRQRAARQHVLSDPRAAASRESEGSLSARPRPRRTATRRYRCGAVDCERARR